MFSMKVICLCLLLAISVEAGPRKTNRGSSNRGSGSSSSSGSKYSTSQVAKPSYSSYPKQQQPLQKSAPPYPVQNSGYHPQASAPQLPSNPAYRPGVAPVYPNQQRPAYPQYQQPNYGAAATAPHPPYAAAPSHFQQPGYGGQQHYPQQPGYGGYHQPAGAQPVPQVVNNYYGGAGGGVGAGTGGVPVVQKSRSGPGIGTSLLAGAASGVAGAALYNALTPSRHGSTTIVREVDRPVDRVVEVDRQAAPRQDMQPQPNYNNQPIAPPPVYVDPSQGAFARKSDQGQPVYCDELPPMAPMPPANVQPVEPIPPTNLTDTTVSAEPVTNMPVPPPMAPGYNAALGCIVRSPYGPDNGYQPPPYNQNGYYGQEGFQNTNQLNQAGYAPDDRAPYVGGQQGASHGGRLSSKAVYSNVPFIELVILLVATVGVNFVRY